MTKVSIIRTCIQLYECSAMYCIMISQFSFDNSSFQAKKDIEKDNSKGLEPGKSADCYNGAVLDRYSWSQTIRDIEVKIPVPSSIIKGRDVGVEIKSGYLKVWLKKGVSPITGKCAALTR